MNVRCQCGSVNFQTPLKAPLRLFHCHCSHCRRQSSSAFGTSAIFPAFAFPIDTQPIALFVRPTFDGGKMECYFCKLCGCRVIHQVRNAEGLVEKEISVKAGAIEGLDWSGAEHIYCDDMVVRSMAIPEGVKAWRQAPDDDDDGLFDGSKN